MDIVLDMVDTAVTSTFVVTLQVPKSSPEDIDHGPGYRVYFVRRQQSVVLLVGGNKKSQNRDIDKATKMAQRL